MSAPFPTFAELFGRPPEAAAEAPGRVNLMGEHTDYNGGLVLPIATPQKTRVELAKRSDRVVRAVSAATGIEPAQYVLGEEVRRGQWVDYIQGVTRALAEAGIATPGFDIRISSDVPLGSGLSSSAALEVSLLRGLRSLFGVSIDDVTQKLQADGVESFSESFDELISTVDEGLRSVQTRGAA